VVIVVLAFVYWRYLHVIALRLLAERKANEAAAAEHRNTIDEVYVAPIDQFSQVHEDASRQSFALRPSLIR
jgi:hypothetical protein